MSNKHDIEVRQKINFRKESWKIIMFSLLVFLPSLSFIVIFYLNPNRIVYTDNFNIIKDYFTRDIVPRMQTIEIYTWFGFSLVTLVLITIGFYPLIFKKLMSKKVLKNILIVGTLIMMLTGIIMIAIGQYNYSEFFNIFKFMINLETDIVEITRITELFSENYNNGKIFGWSGNSFTWWICFFQIITVTVSIYLYLIKVNPENFDKNSEEITKLKLIKDSVGQTKIHSLIERVSVNNVKSLSVLLMVLTILIIIPQLFFIISSSMPNSIVGSIYDWTFKAPNFFRSVNPDFKNLVDISGTKSFMIVYLPIIMTGFLISSIVIFLLIYIRDLEISNRLFVIQLVVIFFESTVTIILNTISLSEINQLIEMWNSNDLKLLQMASNFSNTSIFNNAILKYTGTGISDLIITGNRYIALCIISLSSIVCVYVIHINKILKS